MTISMTKEPSGIYPAYNDSFIEFSSDLADNNKAEITVYPTTIFEKVFVLYPNSDGVYLFNLKEPVKVIFNEDGFNDSNFFDDAFYKSITGLYLSQNVLIKVYSDIADEEVLKTYEFYKAIKQIGVDIIDAPFQLLSYTTGGIDHHLTYFEGFPFHFDIQRVVYSIGKVLTVKSLNSGIESGGFAVTNTGAFRMNVDRSEGVNWTAENILPLIEGLNRLEIYEAGTFRSNILLTKKSKCSGVYLKWFNSEGGFSHFLFDEYFVESIKGSGLGFVGGNDFENVPDIIGMSKSIGKQGSKAFIVKSKYDSNEYNVLRDILISPLVQIYTSFEANIKGKFIDVNIEGSFNYRNKRALNEIVLNIELPALITAKL